MKSLQKTLKRLEVKVSKLELEFRKQLYNSECSFIEYIEIWDMLDNLKQALAKGLFLIQKIERKTKEGVCDDEDLPVTKKDLDRFY